jgi:hypothetical protein
MLKKDIETEKAKIRELMRSKIAIVMKGKNQDLQLWQAFLKKLKEDEVKNLNLSINRFNLLVPLLNSQMVHFNLDKESEIIFSKHLITLKNEKANITPKKDIPIEPEVNISKNFLNIFLEKLLKIINK